MSGTAEPNFSKSFTKFWRSQLGPLYDYALVDEFGASDPLYGPTDMLKPRRTPIWFDPSQSEFVLELKRPKGRSQLQIIFIYFLEAGEMSGCKENYSDCMLLWSTTRSSMFI
ncbi:hypothetical protein OROMI_002954 [Orobanche minor]